MMIETVFLTDFSSKDMHFCILRNLFSTFLLRSPAAASQERVINGGEGEPRRKDAKNPVWFGFHVSTWRVTMGYSVLLLGMFSDVICVCVAPWKAILYQIFVVFGRWASLTLMKCHTEVDDCGVEWNLWATFEWISMTFCVFYCVRQDELCQLFTGRHRRLQISVCTIAVHNGTT